MRRDNGIRLLIVFLVVAAMLSGVAAFFVSAQEKETSARAAALYEPKTKRFLYSKNENARLPMASTTKIMTALVAAESVPLDRRVIIPKEAVGVEGSSAYLKEGEDFSVEELLYALLLQSANDAAVALAHAVAGSVEGFALMMNDKADALGLSDTNFTNPHGLDDAAHFTTAAELAKIAAAMLENDVLKTICSTKKKTVTSGDTTRVFYNHNKLLNLYDGACGVKTGFTKVSGRCLVGAAERDGVTLVSVTLDAPNDWADHRAMLDLGFQLTENRLIAEKGDFRYTLPVLDSDKECVTAALEGDVRAVLLKTDAAPSADVRLSRFLVAPLSAGDAVGEVVFTLDGKEIATAKLVLLDGAQAVKKKGLFERLFDIFKK